MKEVTLEKNKQSKVKVLSKILYIVAKIGKIFSYVAIPFIVLAMVVVPLLLDNLEFKGNQIKVKNTNKSVSLIEKNDKLIIDVNGAKVAEISDLKDVKKVKGVFNDNLKTSILVCSEITLVFELALIVLTILMLRHVEKLFKNIYKESTPFTMDNINHIKKIAIIAIISIILPIILDIIINVVLKGNFNIKITSTSIFEILCLFVLTYIFEYGYKLQQNSKLTMYDER